MGAPLNAWAIGRLISRAVDVNPRWINGVGSPPLEAVTPHGTYRFTVASVTADAAVITLNLVPMESPENIAADIRAEDPEVEGEAIAADIRTEDPTDLDAHWHGGWNHAHPNNVPGHRHHESYPATAYNPWV